MIKTYRMRSSGKGGETRTWGEVWEGQELSEKYLDSIVWDGYTELFNRYLPSNALVLEAGCGLGKYVIYLKRNDHRVIGVDLEGQALWRAQVYEPGLALNVADVTSLPFAPGAFDAYISLGVIEHFESGPELVLAEACRVLHKGGLAFISVPYQHLLKNLSLRLAPSELHQRVPSFIPHEETNGEKEFYQYAFTRWEIAREIRKAGFRILVSYPCSRLHWFLHRAPVRLLRSRLRSVESPREDQSGLSKKSQPAGHKQSSRALELVPRLQRIIPGWLSGHMVMVVAVRE